MANTSRDLFAEVERLADEFDPRLCDEYVSRFSEIFAKAAGLDCGELRARYERIRAPRKFAGADPDTVFVLSRVTLGADVAVTSVLLDAAKRRFPKAEIVFAGPRKNWELFTADRRIALAEVGYRRTGSLVDRLSAWPELRRVLDVPGSIVLDPDSRLTQLGLLPVCDEPRYYFYESRAYGAGGDDSLVTLTKQWAGEVLGVADARAFIAPQPSELVADVTISLGVGGNPAKRIADPFETELLRLLANRFGSVLVDTGAGGEERDRVLRAVAQSGAPNIRTWSGAFAPFAWAISQGKFYAGYDSAGQHVAAACGIPLLTVFAGFVSPRMFSRWYPTGPGPVHVIRVDTPDPALVLEEVRAALAV